MAFYSRSGIERLCFHADVSVADFLGLILRLASWLFPIGTELSLQVVV
jgi:hypothetical protein